MWLFDDILKKPTPTGSQDPSNGSGWGSWATPTPVIVKTESSTIFGPESESQAINELNKWPAEPLVHAEEDYSSVLISQAKAISTPIAPVAPAPEPMTVTPAPEEALTQVPVAQETQTPVDPMVTPTPVEWTSNNTLTMPTEPTPEQATVQAPTAPVANVQIPPGPSLFDHLMHSEEEAVAPVAQQTPESIPVASVVEVPVATQASQPPAPSLATSPVNSSEYSTPRAFIEKSIENIGMMLENIDAHHTAKMTEAEGYRMEKMRFAELEKNAYAEAEIMDRERDHAERMRSIFERELEADEANRTRKTTSENTMEKHPHTHRKHAHQDEEVMAAS